MKPQLKWTLITGAVLTLGGPMLGISLTVLSMMQTFNTLEKEGVADMTGMSSTISYALIFTASGILAGVIGVIVLLIGLFLWLASRSKTSATSPPLPGS